MVEIAELLNQVGNTLKGITSPTAPVVQDGKLATPTNPMPRWQRILSGTIPEVGASIVAAPTDLYTLADVGSRYFGGPALPGAEGAREFSESVRKPVREFTNRLAGEPLSDNLLSGDAEQLLGAWTRLGVTAGATAPAGVGIAAANAAAKLKTGIDVVDKVGTGALKTLEVLSPVVISKNPTPGLVAANVGVAGGLGAGLEAVLGPVQNNEEAKAKLDGYSKGAQDSAAEGIQEAKQVKAGVGRKLLAGTYSAPLLYIIRRMLPESPYLTEGQGALMS